LIELIFANNAIPIKTNINTNKFFFIFNLPDYNLFIIK